MHDGCKEHLHADDEALQSGGKFFHGVSFLDPKPCGDESKFHQSGDGDPLPVGQEDHGLDASKLQERFDPRQVLPGGLVEDDEAVEGPELAHSVGRGEPEVGVGRAQVTFMQLSDGLEQEGQERGDGPDDDVVHDSSLDFAEEPRSHVPGSEHPFEGPQMFLLPSFGFQDFFVGGEALPGLLLQVGEQEPHEGLQCEGFVEHPHRIQVPRRFRTQQHEERVYGVDGHHEQDTDHVPLQFRLHISGVVFGDLIGGQQHAEHDEGAGHELHASQVLVSHQQPHRGQQHAEGPTGEYGDQARSEHGFFPFCHAAPLLFPFTSSLRFAFLRSWLRLSPSSTSFVQLRDGGMVPWCLHPTIDRRGMGVSSPAGFQERGGSGFLPSPSIPFYRFPFYLLWIPTPDPVSHGFVGDPTASHTIRW
eukprot:scaffold431_cov334-Pavlova_lutheri.AAC.125